MLGSCNLPAPPEPPVTKESGMSSHADDIHWAVNEFAEAELGDLRRTKRVIELAGVLAQHPTAALPEACGDGAMLKAAYRFFSNDAIEPHDVLHSHIEATYGRLHHVPVVLAVQDTTEVDWTSHPATRGLGPLGHRACQGLLVHSTLAFTPERVPLGLLAQQVWARDPADVGKRTRRKQLPISQKESQKWLTSLDGGVPGAGRVSPDPLCQHWRSGSRCLRPAGGRASGGRRAGDSGRVGPVCQRARALCVGHRGGPTGGGAPPLAGAPAWPPAGA